MITISSLFDLTSILSSFMHEVKYKPVDIIQPPSSLLLSVMDTTQEDVGFTITADRNIWYKSYYSNRSDTSDKLSCDILSAQESLNYQSNASNIKDVYLESQKRSKQFTSYCNQKQISIEYQKLVTKLFPDIISLIYSKFPFQARILRGLEIYPMRNPTESSTLAVSKYKKSGIERVYMIYNPKFLVDTAISDVLLGKYSIAEILAPMAYVIVHELSHLVKSQLSEYSLNKVSSLRHGIVNTIMDVGINSFITRNSGWQCIGTGISPGLYFKFSVVNKDKVLTELESLCTSITRDPHLAKKSIKYISQISTSSVLKVTIGAQLEDTSQFLSTLNNLARDNAISLKSTRQDEVKDQLLNDIKKDKSQQEVPSFEQGDTVVDINSGDLYIVIKGVGPQSVVVKILNILNFTQVRSLQTITNNFSTPYTLPKRILNSKVVSNTSVILVPLKNVSVGRLFLPGDYVVDSETKVIYKLLEFEPYQGGFSFNLPVEEIDFKDLPSDPPLSIADYVSRIIDIPNVSIPLNYSNTSTTSESTISVDTTTDFKLLASKIISQSSSFID